MKNDLNTKLRNLKFGDIFFQKSFYFFLAVIGLLIFAYSTVRLDNQADEGCYLTFISNSKNIFDFSCVQYNSLNGRIIANALMYILLKYNLMIPWGIISILAIISIAFNISRVFNKTNVKEISLVIMLICCCSYRLLSSAYIWFTGAIFYLWPSAVGIWLLVPIAKTYFSDYKIKFGCSYILYTLAGITVMLWSEQVALVVICFYILSLGRVVLIEKKRVNAYQLVQIILFIAAFLVLMLAPSQTAKMDAPFEYIALRGGIKYVLDNGLFWTFKTVFVEQRILIILAGFIIIVCADRSKFLWLIRIFEVIFSIAILQGINNMQFATSFALPFQSIYDLTYLVKANLSLNTLFPYIFWATYGFLLIFLAIVNSADKYVSFMLTAASSATLVIMWISPSMYVSGNRTSCLFALGIIAVLYSVICHCKKDFIYAISAVGVTNLFFFSLHLSENFMIYY